MEEGGVESAGAGGVEGRLDVVVHEGEADVGGAVSSLNIDTDSASLTHRLILDKGVYVYLGRAQPILRDDDVRLDKVLGDAFAFPSIIRPLRSFPEMDRVDFRIPIDTDHLMVHENGNPLLLHHVVDGFGHICAEVL